MSAINPANFKRPPKQILNDLLALRIDDRDLLYILREQISQHNPDQKGKNPFGGKRLYSRRVMENEFGDRRFVEYIKDFREILHDLKGGTVIFEKLSNQEKRALKEGLEIVLSGLYKYHVSLSTLDSKHADNARNIAGKEEQGIPLTPTEQLLRNIRETTAELKAESNPENQDTPEEMKRKDIAKNMQSSQYAEQDAAFCHEAGKLMLELCNSIDIPVNAAARAFVSRELGA